ncbi:short-chain dehydrogenase/reductase 3-like [Haliotis rufescens]|uniref:short-chain dehydrogenase/reductase 3-like n=1 Tax=Haliotis rufescens TaxID=6454 RepID=UPI00201ECD62|nr:short-chain dehydrogenase/reductase 3-like [Haliotis rufescens]
MLTALVQTASLLIKVTYSVLHSLVSYIFPPTFKDISEDVILITGGGKGIGKKIAIGFARRRPSHIILWGRHGNTLEQTQKEIKELGVKCSYMICDVSNKENIYDCAKQVKDAIGEVTILVNNAGVVYGNPILTSSDDDVVKTMQVNVIAHFWTQKAFLPAMIEHNKGHIVSISSVLGLMGLSGAGDYVSAKFGSTGMAEALSDELRVLGKTGVKVTSVHPYHIDNTMFDGLESRLSRWLIPPLSEDYVANKTIHAVLTNRCKILMPRVMYFLNWFKNVSPIDVTIALARVTGTDRAMDGFKGHARAS